MCLSGTVKRYSREEIDQYEKERAKRLLKESEEKLQREKIIWAFTVPPHRKLPCNPKYPNPGCHKAGHSHKEENKFPDFQDFHLRKRRYDSTGGMDPSKCRHGFLPQDCGTCKAQAETVQALKARLAEARRKTRERNAKKRQEELEKARRIKEYWASQPPPTVVENKFEKAALYVLNTLLSKMPDRSKKGARARIIEEMLERLGIEGLSADEILKMLHERMATADTFQDYEFFEEAIRVVQSEDDPDSRTIDEREQDRAFYIWDRIGGRKSSPPDLSDPKKVKNLLRRGKKIVEEAQRGSWAAKQRERRYRKRAISVTEGSMDFIYNRHEGRVFAVSKTKPSSDDQEAKNYKEHVGYLEAELGKKQQAESDRADDINISPPSTAELGTELDELGDIPDQDDPESEPAQEEDPGNGGEDEKNDKPLRAIRRKFERLSFDAGERNHILAQLRKRQRLIDQECGKNATNIFMLKIKNPKIKAKQISQELGMSLRAVRHRLATIRAKRNDVPRLADLKAGEKSDQKMPENITK